VGKMSRDKGARGEREIKDMHNEFFELHGHDMRLERNQMQTLNGGFDLIGVPILAIEIKLQEQFSLKAWWEQTVAQAQPGQYPILFYRRNRVVWRVRMQGAVWETDHHGIWDRPSMVIDIATEDYFRWLKIKLENEDE
jgi:hypothetical protein